jgi:hypothetical protein
VEENGGMEEREDIGKVEGSSHELVGAASQNPIMQGSAGAKRGRGHTHDSKSARPKVRVPSFGATWCFLSAFLNSCSSPTNC